MLRPCQTIQERNSTLRGQGDIRILRTCYRYSEADERRHRLLVSTFHLCRREPGRTLYNDKSRYSFSDSTEIFQRVPDLLSPQYFGKGSDFGKRWWVVEPYLHSRDQRATTSSKDIASLAIVTYLLVEDEAFFDGQDPLLLFCDEFGRVVVSKRAIDLALAQRSQHMTWNGFAGNISDDDISPEYREDGVAIKQWRRWLEKQALTRKGATNASSSGTRRSSIQKIFGRRRSAV